MKWQTLVRLVGMITLVAFGVLAAEYGLGNRELLMLVAAIVAIVAPEALDELPWGPNKE